MADEDVPCFRFHVQKSSPNPNNQEAKGGQSKAKVASFLNNLIENYVKEEPHSSFCKISHYVVKPTSRDPGHAPSYRVEMHGGSDWDTLSLDSAVSASVEEESRKIGTRGRQYNNKTSTLAAQASAASESVYHYGITPSASSTDSDGSWVQSASSSSSLDLTTSMESYSLTPISSRPRTEFGLTFIEIVECDSAGKSGFNGSMLASDQGISKFISTGRKRKMGLESQELTNYTFPADSCQPSPAKKRKIVHQTLEHARPAVFCPGKKRKMGLESQERTHSTFPADSCQPSPAKKRKIVHQTLEHARRRSSVLEHVLSFRAREAKNAKNAKKIFSIQGLQPIIHGN